MLSFFGIRFSQNFSFARAGGQALPLCLALGLLVFAGCDTGTIGDDDVNVPGTLPAQMAGTWASSYNDRYVIEENALEYYFEDDEWPFEYAGTIEFVSNYSSNSGVIIFKRTSGTYYDLDSNNFTATYYRNLNSSTVQLADVFDLVNSSSADTATLAEAVEKFTRGKMGNYVSQWGSYTKSNP